MEKEEAVRPLIHIIHNITRHRDGINSLKSVNALSLIQQLQNDMVADNNNEMISLIHTVLNLLSKPAKTTVIPTTANQDSDSVAESSAISWYDYESDDDEEEKAKIIDISDEGVFSYILTRLRNLRDKISHQKEFEESKNKQAKLSGNEKDKLSQDLKTKESKNNETELS